MSRWFRSRSAFPGSPRGHAGQGYEDAGQEHAGTPDGGSYGGTVPAGATGEAEGDGERFGAARIPRSEAASDQSGPNRTIDGRLRTRIGAVTQGALHRRQQASIRVATKESRQQASLERRDRLGDQLRYLFETKLPPVQGKVADAKADVERTLARFDGLARHLKGYFGSWLVMVMIELFVVLFDGWILHGALKRSGFSSDTVLFTSLTVPLVIFAANHGFGLLAGAIGLRADRADVKLAAAAFAAGFAALFLGFVLLAVFRSEATSGYNAALLAWARGNQQTNLSFFISPTWLAPVQIAGSIAAIVTVALYTMSKEGRELKQLLAGQRQILHGRERELAGIEAEIESTNRQIREAAVAVHEIAADAAAAGEEIAAHPDLLGAQIEAQEGWAETAKGRFLATYEYISKIYENGGVWRVALRTTVGFWRRYTPAPEDKIGAPPSDPTRNGYRQMPLENFEHSLD